jgi:hypothetical protein
MISSLLPLSRTPPFYLWLTYRATIEGSGGPVSTGGTGSSAHTSSAAQTTPPPVDPCPTYSPCVEIGNAINSCQEDSCFCPTLLAYGSQCSSCFVPVNTTEAAGLSLLMSECISEGYSAFNTGAGLTTTHSQVSSSSAQVQIVSPSSHTVPLTTVITTANPGTTTSGNPSAKTSAAEKSVSFAPVFCALLAVLGASLVILFA